MRYSIEQYDKYGFVKAPKCLWLGWFLMAKAWVVFVVAGASRQNGSMILNIIYPDHIALYFGLMMGLPSIVMMWLISLRSPEREWVNKIVSWGKGITLLTIVSQIIQGIYHVYLEKGAFSWVNGIIMLLLVWFAVYVIKSRSVQDCFHYRPSI